MLDRSSGCSYLCSEVFGGIIYIVVCFCVVSYLHLFVHVLGVCFLFVTSSSVHTHVLKCLAASPILWCDFLPCRIAPIRSCSGGCGFCRFCHEQQQQQQRIRLYRPDDDLTRRSYRSTFCAFFGVVFVVTYRIVALLFCVNTTGCDAYFVLL